MNLIEYKKVDGCIEGDYVFDLFLDDKITGDFIRFIGEFGKLIYTDTVPKPYFSIIVRGKFTLKGSQNNKEMRIILSDSESIKYLEELKEFISRFKK